MGGLGKYGKFVQTYTKFAIIKQDLNYTYL